MMLRAELGDAVDFRLPDGGLASGSRSTARRIWIGSRTRRHYCNSYPAAALLGRWPPGNSGRLCRPDDAASRRGETDEGGIGL